MSAKIRLSVNGIPDGTYATVLDQADGTRVTRQGIYYTDGKANVFLPVPLTEGTRLKGYVDDSATISASGAYIEGLTYETFWLPTFDPASASNIKLTNPMSFTGDYEIEIVGLFSALNSHIVSNSSTASPTDHRLAFYGRKVLVRGEYVGTLTDSTFLEDDKLHKVVFKKDSTTFEVIVDGVTQLSTTDANALVALNDIDSIGKTVATPTSVPNFSGQIHSASFTGATGITGTAVLTFDIPDGAGDTLMASNGVTTASYDNIPDASRLEYERLPNGDYQAVEIGTLPQFIEKAY